MTADAPSGTPFRGSIIQTSASNSTRHKPERIVSTGSSALSVHRSGVLAVARDESSCYSAARFRVPAFTVHRRFWIHCGYRQPHTRERVLPTATADLIFAVDSVGRARSSIAGPRSTFVELETSRPFSALGIHFKPGGASPFFDSPSSELRDRHVALDLLWGTFAATVSDRLWSASGVEDQFEVLEDALRQKMRQPRMRYPAVQYAVDALQSSQRRPFR